MEKRVSIIIPTYNRTSFIEEAIGSALNQTYKPAEILIIDDGSDDEYKATLKKLKAMSDLISVVHLPSRLGVSHARNEGVKKAKGDFVLFLDDDDLIHHEMLDSCLKTFDQFIEADIVITGGELKDLDFSLLDHREKQISINSMTRLSLLHNQNNSALYFILYGMSLIHSFMFKREVLLQYPFDESLEIGEDTYQWMLLKKRGFRFRKISLRGAIYRMHPGQVSQTKSTDSDKFNYLKKAMSLLSSGIEQDVFILMNRDLLDKSGIRYKNDQSKPSLTYMLTWLWIKLFMLTNRIKRAFL